ncbi:MAG: SDR family oxidoreductase [Longimicrobiales bacterium]|nr:SDR family oxidoreductase [Longimicrobiales bacterium]
MSGGARDSGGTGAERRTVVVTGTSSGIGRAIARQIAEEGHRVLMVCRNEERGREALDEIVERTGNEDVELLLADLSSQADLRALAKRIEALTPRLDVLLHNAGTFMRDRRESADGIEMQLAVNYLAPFLLTRLLHPLLERSAPSRVVVVSSMEHRLGRIDFDDLQLARRYSGGKAYRQSKLATVLFTREAAKRFEGTGVTVNAVHPGVAYTGLVDSISRLSRLVTWALKTPDEAARGPVHLALAREIAGRSGVYHRGSRVTRPAARARDDRAAERLWEVSERLTGLR